VKERIELKRKEANWDQPHRLLTSEVNRKLSQEQNGNKSTDNLTPLEKLAKEDLEASLEVNLFILILTEQFEGYF